MAADVVAFVDDSASPPVRGTLHPAADPSTGDALVLAHGAGSDHDAFLLVSLAEAFARRGLSVLRCDLPFRQERRHGPPARHAAERDRAGLLRAVESVRSRVPGRIMLGGHSYGGRQASMLAAERPGLTAALLLLAYPLHPPRRPATPRTSHFAELRTPILFVHGTRDPFGTIEAVRAAMSAIPARRSLLVVEGGGHELVRPCRRAAAEDLGNKVTTALLDLIADEGASSIRREGW